MARLCQQCKQTIPVEGKHNKYQCNEMANKLYREKSDNEKIEQMRLTGFRYIGNAPNIGGSFWGDIVRKLISNKVLTVESLFKCYNAYFTKLDEIQWQHICDLAIKFNNLGSKAFKTASLRKQQDIKKEIEIMEEKVYALRVSLNRMSEDSTRVHNRNREKAKRLIYKQVDNILSGKPLTKRAKTHAKMKIISMGEL